MSFTESHDIVIIGGGICGLATALALHRKGLDSIVLERSDTLRTAGLAIGVHSNGWRALDQLRVGAELRRKAVLLSGIRTVMIGSCSEQDITCGNEEFRCLKRSDLIEALSDSLPPGSIRFGCQAVAIGEDPVTSFPSIHLRDGSTIHAKVLIGCDGVNSIVAKLLGLAAPKFFSFWVTRGFTYFPDGHGLDNFFHFIHGDGVYLGMLPINENLVHWFMGLTQMPPGGFDPEIQKEPELLKDTIQGMLEGFPEVAISMVRNSDTSSLLLSHLQFRAPWSLLSGKIRKGTVTVAGDAMHVMGPFLGQGGCCALEDAIVLARNLAQELRKDRDETFKDEQLKIYIESAIDRYIKERKWRVLRLSTQTYLRGLMLQSSWKLMKIAMLLILMVFFGGSSFSHVHYDCGQL